LRHTQGGTASNLAIGRYDSVIGTLSTTNGQLTRTDTTINGLLARAGCLPQDRTNPNAAMNTIAQIQANPCLKGTPWNFYHTNPQYSGASLYYNGYLTNYHSMQTQVTLRPTHGLNFQATWTWSRNLSNSGWTNYLGDRYEDRDYALSGQHRSHTLNTYGSYELPFGPRGFFFRDASGFVKKIVEGWQLSWVTQMSSGSPSSLTGQNTMWSNSYPNLVRPDLWDNKAGNTGKWDFERNEGWYFGRKYARTLDTNICREPGTNGGLTQTLFNEYCVAPSSTSSWGVMRGTAPRAIALANDDGSVARYNSLNEALKYDPDAREEHYQVWNTQANKYDTITLMPAVIVFRNADQRNGANARGNYGANTITGQGRFSFDMAASKSIEFMEGKRFEVRVDAQNILNHATPTNGTSASYGGRYQSINNPGGLSVSGTGEFGRLSTKGGHRTFQARLRLSF
jgi:hypothetical protein